MNLPDFLTKTDYGGIRVTGHRIGLEHLVELYQDGRSAEMIALDFPTLPLATIHRVLAFTLDHREEVDRYMRELEDDATGQVGSNDGVVRGPSRSELVARIEANRKSGAA